MSTSERVTFTADQRQLWRQAGWLGHAGAFYAMDTDPSLTEKGGFSPLWQQVEGEPYVPGVDAEVYEGGYWELFDGGRRIGFGTQRNRFLRELAIRRATKRYEATR